MHTLSIRTRNILSQIEEHLGIELKTQKQLRRAVQTKILHPDNPAALGFGRQAFDEVRALVGLKPIISPERTNRARGLIAANLKDKGYTTEEIRTIMRFPGKKQTIVHIAQGYRFRQTRPGA